jgi:hypothetical protein
MILCFAVDSKLADKVFGVPARWLIREGVVEPVTEHAVIELPVAQAIAPAAARHQVRCQIHILHAARHRDVDRAEENLLRRRHNGLRPRAADAVHSHCRDRDRQPRTDRRLTRWVHLGAGLNDVSHHRGVHLLGLEPGTRDSRLNGDGAEIGRRNFLEAAAESADRGSHRIAENDCTWCRHGCSLRFMGCSPSRAIARPRGAPPHKWP